MVRFCTVLFCLASWGSTHAAPAHPIYAQDVDNQKICVNPGNSVTVVISSSESTQKQTREAEAVLDEFQGRPGFRMIIVVDMQNSVAGLLQGYTRSRIRANLDKKAKRIKPAYLANGNSKDPRADLVAIPDFSGNLCRKLGWKSSSETLRAIIFDTDGNPYRTFDPLENLPCFQDAVRDALPAWAMPGAAKAAKKSPCDN